VYESKIRGFGTSKELSSNLQVVTDDTQKSFLDETVLTICERYKNTPKLKNFFKTNPYGKLWISPCGAPSIPLINHKQAYTVYTLK